MNFFKIFKALNSAQSSWQVALAVAFGLFSGFLPLFTLINLFIIVIVFSLNIPISIFIISSALFSTLAFALDPIFASVGYDILTNNDFNSLFTSMYNFAPTLWSSFNYTIIMGSFIVSIILFIPTYYIFKLLIDKYRLTLEKYFKDSKYFSFLNPFSQKKLDKKPGIFRWWGGLLILTIIAIILAFFMLILDPIIKFTLEYTLSKASKKEVFIDNVNSSFLNGTLDINNIIIKSNKEKNNDISINKISLNIDIKRLLHKNVSINSLVFQKVILKTSLDTKNKENATKTIDNLDINKKISSKDLLNKFDMPNIDEILQKEDLQSLKQAKIIKEDTNKIYTKYKNFDNSQFDKEKLKQLKQKIIILSKKVKNIKDISQIQSIIDEANEIKKEISILEDKIKNVKDEYNKDKTLLSKHLKTIKTLPKKEYEYLINKYTFDKNGALNFVGTYISKDMQIYINKALKYYKIIKPYISSEEDMSVEQKRLNGIYIQFKQKVPYPSFVLKDLKADVKINELNFTLNTKNISNNQKIYQKEIIGYIKGEDKLYKQALINFTHNELKDIPLTNINAKIIQFKNKNFELNKNLSLNDSLINSKSKIIIKGFKSIKASLDTTLTKTSIDYKLNTKKSDKIIKSILSNIKSFDLNAKVDGNLEKPSISLNSNLDKKIAKGLKSQINKELSKFKEKLKIKVKEKFKNELGKDISDEDFKKVSTLISSFSKDNNSIKNSLENYLNKDYLKAKIEDKIKNKAKDKAKEKINNLLKDKLKSLF